MSVFTPVVPAGTEMCVNDYNFSPAVRSGDLLIISGQLGFKEDMTLPTDAATQIAQALGALAYILDSEGLTVANLISIDSFHVGDMHEHFELMVGELGKVFGEGPYPSWTAVGTTGLALPEAVVEIKAMARIT